MQTFLNFWLVILFKLISHYNRMDLENKIDIFLKRHIFSNVIINKMKVKYNRILQLRRKIKLKKIRNKGKCRVLFVCPDKNVFALKELYEVLIRNQKFECVIGVPIYNHLDKNIGTDNLKYLATKKYFEDQGINAVLLGEDRISIKKSIKNINADIIFFNSTMAVQSVIDIFHLSMKKITIYVSYGFFLTALQNEQFNTKDINRFDYLFWETPLTLCMSKKYSYNLGGNSFYLGYPKLDKLKMVSVKNNEPPWKPQKTIKKKIIWAPHHSIENNSNSAYGFSCFLVLAEFMLDCTKKYKDQVQFAFKPHPLLKHRLYKTEGWGKLRTDEYYSEWIKRENCQLEMGDYDYLFIFSDGMIMDSISFICEYAVVNKPNLFTIKDDSILNKFNELGKKAFDMTLYKTGNNLKQDVINFIETIIIHEKDPIKNERAKFVKEELKLPFGNSASENIANFLEQEIGW